MRRRDLAVLAVVAAGAPREGGAQARLEAGRAALRLADAGRWREAEAAATGADPAIGALIEWQRLGARAAAVGTAELVRGVLARPGFPGQDAMVRRVEEALAAEPDDTLAAEWFAARAPAGLAGWRRLGEALLRAGRVAQARAVLRRGWLDAPGDAAAEAGYLGAHAGALDAGLHWQRFDRIALARRGAPGALVPLLAPDRQGVAAARLRLAADAAADAAGTDFGLAHERARWLRRSDRDAEAAAVWTAGAGPPDPTLPADAVRVVWTERQLLIRRLLRLGLPGPAQAVAAGHGIAAPGEPRQEAEFLAGFIALRRGGAPAIAAAHFARVGEGSRSAITRARSLYWQGRAGGGATRYREAAAFATTFYGQLAAVALGDAPGARVAGLEPPAVGAAEAAAFAAAEPVRVVRALAAIGETGRTRPFLLRLSDTSETLGGKLLAARLALEIGRPDHAVWVVRRAGADGLVAVAEGWPAPWPVPPGGVEAALVLAVTRQESNFDPLAVSTSNARGLMQLLPSTAAEVARRLGVRVEIGALTADPALNMRLGAAYLEELLARFGGAVPLAVAAYNAGPRRVDEWLGVNGDPRGRAVGVLDWIELIPFAETRNYVQRVIENVVVYRARAGVEAPHPLAGFVDVG